MTATLDDQQRTPYGVDVTDEDKRRREVVLHEPETGRRRGRLWAYGYATLAALYGVKEQTVRLWVSRGDLDPASLGDVLRVARERGPK